MTILCIDTATKVCSAALWSNGKVVAHKIYDGEANHARSLPLYIDELLAIARERSLHIDAVALSEGPGSYTGLRIGAGTAKGLCYALDIPLIPIPTTEVMCQGLKELKSERRHGSLSTDRCQTDGGICRILHPRHTSADRHTRHSCGLARSSDTTGKDIRQTRHILRRRSR